MSFRYRPFSHAIIHELLDDEVIIANLDNGAYFSLRGPAATIWQLVVAGFSIEDICNQIAQKHDLSAGDVLFSVETFIKQLCLESLLSRSEQSHVTPVLPDDIYWPQTWGEIEFEKYDEMKNLLMLDPVHEVDGQGWPSRSAK